ncbi:MAG: SRPBCC family protein [Rhizobiaceae bacterium]
MLTTILLLILLIIVALLAYAATRPGSFRIERNTSIKATPEKISALLEDFREWRKWSPWEELDPNLKRNYSGAEKGVGAAYAWEGNNKAGHGRMEILEASPRRVRIKLDFLKPFKASNTAEFTLTPAGENTTVNWAMHGAQPFMVKLMSIFMDMEKMVGPDFEKGLAAMKRAAEQ